MLVTYPVTFTVEYRLDGTPARLTARWMAPDASIRKVEEELPESCTAEEVHDMMKFLQGEISRDPF